MAVQTPYQFSTATGAAAINTSVSPACSGMLHGVYLHLSAAGGTSENLTITINAAAGAAYDTVIYTRDMQSVTNVALTDLGVTFYKGDTIDIAYANSNSRTYGLTVVYTKGV